MLAAALNVTCYYHVYTAYHTRATYVVLVIYGALHPPKNSPTARPVGDRSTQGGEGASSLIGKFVEYKVQPTWLREMLAAGRIYPKTIYIIIKI